MEQLDYIKYNIIVLIILIIINHQSLPNNIKTKILYIFIFFIGYLFAGKYNGRM